jgi:hypothetical protein
MGQANNIVTVYLKGPWARGDKDWDRGILMSELHRSSVVTLADNEYGAGSRSYPVANVARIEQTGHW